MKYSFYNKFVFSSFLLLLCSLSCTAQNTLTIATWNLEHLGKSKKDSTIDFIARTISSFDVTAIQEVVGNSGGKKAVERLRERLNEIDPARHWNYIISDGPSHTSKYVECYAFIWDNSVKMDTAWLDKKYAKQIEREPYMATFTYQRKTFTLVNFHAVPKHRQPEHEIKYLKYTPKRFPVLNLIFLGDFNTPQSNNVFNPLKKMGYKPVLKGQRITLKMKCVNLKCLASKYDNIFYPGSKFRLISSNILRFYQLFPDMKAARKVSDHVPVVFRFAFR